MMDQNSYNFYDSKPLVQPSINNYVRRRSQVLINSKDRDTDAYAQPEEYVIKLPTVFRNVESVKLLSGTIPDLNNARNEPFLILDINELNDTYSKIYSSGENLNIFDVIQYSSHLTTGKFIYIQSGISNIYKPSLAKLSRLTIRIRDQNGDLFSFGDDTVFSSTRQNSFRIEVTELVHNPQKLGETVIF